ncbi:MAG TPA: hypothetical protein VGS08_04205 [Candidatus Saccharimonadales bacterium]|nr:hypothetical protein [Candidatus Saccharimonadales bacterium]
MSKTQTLPLQNQLRSRAGSVVHFRLPLFLLLVIAVYGYVAWRFQALNATQPSQKAIASQTSISQPHIDPVVVNKIKRLQDNSVSVQTLFDQARQDPFQE